MLKNLLSPYILPIYFFGGAILVGAAMLRLPASLTGVEVSWVDAVFTATSATCVTGLAVVDTGATFTRMGQGVILCLIQFGGLGIMTFTSLVFYLWRRRVTLTDRIAVGQGLLHNPSFHLGKFLLRIVLWTLFIEGCGALALFSLAPSGFPPFSALFHSISAFCNAGFSLYADSLMGFRDDWGVNLVIMGLIVLGGIGFTVLVELEQIVATWARSGFRRKARISWYTDIVLGTSAALILAGFACIYLAEFAGHDRPEAAGAGVLAALFQSVTCRTAGFNTLDIGAMTNASLLFMIMLMFVGGSPGSTAGGIKTTTFRALLAFSIAQLKGRHQAVVGKYAVEPQAMSKAITLAVFSLTLVVLATLVLNISEGGGVPHNQSRGNALDVLFEVVSAFGTVGLTTGLTPKLTDFGKIVITLLMFIGRLGPIVFLSVIQSFQDKPHYSWPEETMLVG